MRRSFERSLDPEPDSFSSLFERARAELKSGNAASALAQAEALIGAFPDKSQAFMLKARALAAVNQVEDALEALRDGLHQQPDELKLLNMARNFAAQISEFEQAKEFADRVSELAPTNAKNRAFLVQYYSRSKSHDAALAGADALIAEFPDDASGWVLKTHVLLAQRRRDDAMTAIEDGLEKHPLNAKLLNHGRYVASLQGRTNEAAAYAAKLLEIAPSDHGNRVFLATLAGDFAEILRCSEHIISQAPQDPRGWIVKADALIGLHRIADALEAVRQALSAIPHNPKLLAFAGNLAFRHGRFREALDYALELLDLTPDDRKTQLVATRCMMAAGEFQALAQFLKDAGSRVLEQPLRKSRRYFREYARLRKMAPAITDAWRAALDNPVDRKAASVGSAASSGATMIQYWSQGTPPRDIQLVLSEWRGLLERNGIGELQLFDRSSADVWIEEHAPEFHDLFVNAFHYAMESDIFRIAYASRHPCIYLDTDSWPLDHTAHILKFAVESRRSMLYFRMQRSWLANGFFVSAPNCPFFAELVTQARSIVLEDWPKNRATVGRTFGPARYNKVLLDLVLRAGLSEVSPVTDLPGCSRLTLDRKDIYFSHEAAVAAVKPPFALSYTATGEYWKRLAGK